MRLIKWLIRPYEISIKEMSYLSSRNSDTEQKEEKRRINQLLYFNILLMAVYSLFFLGSIVYIILAFIISWEGLLVLLITIPMMLITRSVQENRYLKRRDAFIKNDPNLIE
ncbi:hypothetical protein M3936_11305 [Sutcliffiella horikoshii]|uniref:hypothetical protein n=1 Tax=Sutcliffiella horikoshii TaxID=79883 RepID=UPI00203FB050|nr:hypothetical protein [Sutcliffiella horikoshii]MCM3618171.1 hypothetical protein [Sutcliffiella horikoshii]